MFLLTKSMAVHRNWNGSPREQMKSNLVFF